ncbi:MAG: Na(+)-translocating NADH-quinone reductase subunit A [Acidobacteriota bacterium]
MAVHKVRQGLNLPIAGEPEQTVSPAPRPERVAIVADDYPGMKPTMHVQEGDAVQRGQLLFEDKKTPGVLYTSPGAGTVEGVYRGAKRVLQSVVVRLDEDERSRGEGAQVAFEAAGGDPAALDAGRVRALLIESGLWTALRTRPFSKVADPRTTPHSIFVTAMDSSPLAPAIAPMLEGRGEDLRTGLQALSRLTEGTVYVCHGPDTALELPTDDRVRGETFRGPHPAGSPGYHIHALDPVSRQKLVWFLGVQDVMAIGRLFRTGQLDLRRIVSFAGPAVTEPRLLETRLGADLTPILDGSLSTDEEVRVISGSVLAGRRAMGPETGFLGRYDQQIAVLREGRERELLGWLEPGLDKFSTTGAFVSAAIPGRKFSFSTSKMGSDRAIVPVGGLYERVFPFDIVPVPLLRALVVQDVERAEALGVLELDEADIALCSFVCPSKNDYGVHLRDVLTTIEKEG